MYVKCFVVQKYVDEMARLPCWEICCIHPGFETQRKSHQKSKTGVSVAPQKELVYSNF